MRKTLGACLAVLFVFSIAVYAFAATAEPNKEAIKKRVDEIVVAMDGGKTAADFKAAASESPYVFIMKPDGSMVVHPTLAEKNIKADMEPVYKELVKADADGEWVTYEWQGKTKNTYVRKAKDGMIVGSGY